MFCVEFGKKNREFVPMSTKYSLANHIINLLSAALLHSSSGTNITILGTPKCL